MKSEHFIKITVDHTKSNVCHRWIPDTARVVGVVAESVLGKQFGGHEIIVVEEVPYWMVKDD